MVQVGLSGNRIAIYGVQLREAEEELNNWRHFRFKLLPRVWNIWKECHGCLLHAPVVEEGLSMKIAIILVTISLWLCACEPAEVTRGREHYETLCALCHGLEGEGYLSPKANALSNQDFLASSTDEFLKI